MKLVKLLLAFVRQDERSAHCPGCGQSVDVYRTFRGERRYSSHNLLYRYWMTCNKSRKPVEA